MSFLSVRDNLACEQALMCSSTSKGEATRDESESQASRQQWEPARTLLFSEYSAFAHKCSILIGEKWQVLLLWREMVSIGDYQTQTLASGNRNVGSIHWFLFLSFLWGLWNFCEERLPRWRFLWCFAGSRHFSVRRTPVRSVDSVVGSWCILLVWEPFVKTFKQPFVAVF